MKDISFYFQPVQIEGQIKENSLGEIIESHTEGNFPTIENNAIAIFEVPEYRNANDIDSAATSNNNAREALYKLYKGDNWTRPVYDLGVVMPGGNIEDTYFAVAQIVSELVK